MNTLLWNVQGLGNPWTIRSLNSLVIRHTLQLVFIMESKLNNVSAEALHVKLGFGGCFVVEAKGKSGCLLLLWSKKVETHVLSFSPFHIDSFIRMEEGQWWRFTSFYGDPDPSQRTQSWKLLNRICRMYSGPWAVGGDFTEILSQKEKMGGPPKPGYLIKNFRKAPDACKLREIAFEGSDYTWCNGRKNNLIFERLDRVCGISDWFDMFPFAQVRHLERTNSDHCPLLLTESDSSPMTTNKTRWRTRFHFESAWADDED
ncbi:hypothetical protein CsatB_019362 [Cannabis sativa]